MISWLLVFGIVLQQGSGFSQAESAKPSSQTTNNNIKMLPDMPFIENYPPKVYQSHNQVFSIAEDRRGMMFFGNGDGWLEFDGAHFRHTSNKLPVYSMALDPNGLMYLGLIGDFGRLLPDSQGKLVFESLTTSLSEKEREFNAVLDIRVNSQGLYFNTVSGPVFRWANEHLHIIDINVGLRLSQVDDHIFGYNDSGIYIFQENRATALPQTKSLCNKGQNLFVLPYQDSQLLIATERKGVFLYSLGSKPSDGATNLDHIQELAGQRVQVFETPVADFLRQHVLTRGIHLTNGNYVFGTWNGGLVFMDSDGRRLQVIDESNGLIDNYVRNLYQDKTGNLWVATNNGISYVELSSPLSRFVDGKQTGYTLTVSRYRDRLFVGGFKGVFYHAGYDRQDRPRLVSIKGSTPLCWDMHVHRDRLLLGGNFGLLLVEGTQVVDRLKTQEMVYSLGTSARFPQHVFVGLRGGFTALTLEQADPKGTQIRLLDKQQGDFAKIKGVIRKIASDPDGHLWLTDLSGQILHLRFRSDQVSDFDVYTYDQRHGLPETNFNMVHIVDDRLIVGTRNGIYTPTNQDLPKPDPALFAFALENTFGRKPNQGNLRVHRIYKEPSGRIWINSFDSVSTLTPRPDGGYEWNRQRYKKIEGNVESMYFDENDVVWFTNTKGLYRYDQKKEPKDALDFRALISQVSVQNGPDLFHGVHCQTDVQSSGVCKKPTLEQNQTMIFDLSYDNNSLTFEFGSTSYERPKLNRYSYKLEGYDKKWSKWTKRSIKEYTSLPEGAYTFRIRAKNIHEHLGKQASYAFRILPPWHRTLWAYVAYIILAAGLIIVGFRIYAWRLLATKKRLEIIVKERTAEVVRQKDEIQRAQKIALQHAHKAGMADIAINTIHNVGNLLSSAKVNMGLLYQSNEKSSVTGYQKANNLLQKNIHRLEDFICRDSTGRKLIEYYLELGKSLQEENKHNLHYLNNIARQLNLISNVIAAQGRYADGAQAPESETHLEELIQDALTMEAESINSNAIRVKPSFDTVPEVKIQHNKLIQVLVNLIKNAIEAMENNTSKRILKISLTHANQDILIKIEDNGEGFKETDLKHIFSQGFSTRSEKRGYGLHDSANFITEMGGKLTGWSEGPGQGACFEIRFSKASIAKP